MFEIRRNNMLLIYLTNKKDKLNRKRKYLLSRKLGMKKRSTWGRFEERTEDWWKKMLSDDASEKFWKKNFRMGKDAFHELVTMLDPYFGLKTTPNYRKLSTSKKVAMVLYYLKDTRSLWMTAIALGYISVRFLKLSYQFVKLSMKYWVRNWVRHRKILTRCERKCQNLKLNLE